jgi:DNA-binding transcriptional ArsR family regulator
MTLPRPARERSTSEVLFGAVGNLIAVDRVLHDPSRLAILSLLRPTGAAGYLELLRATGLSKGNLSNHLTKLEGAGVIEVRKRFVGRRPVTTIVLTDDGASELEAYWEEMERLMSASRPRACLEAFGGGGPSVARQLMEEAAEREELHAALVRDPDVKAGNPLMRLWRKVQATGHGEEDRRRVDGAGGAEGD